MYIVVTNWLRCSSRAAILVASKPTTSSTWSGSSASNSSRADGPVVGDALVGEEERVAGRDDAVDGEPAGVAVVGVQPVAPPRVVAEHDVGLQRADPVGDPLALGRAPTSSSPSTLPSMTTSPVAPSALAAGLLLDARGCDERGDVLVGVPGALRAVGEDQVVHDAAVGRPLGQGGPGLELDVVGMGADGQRDRRRGQVAGRRTAPLTRPASRG